MQIGYARVSTQDQDLRMQYDALGQARCDKIYEDKASGVKTSREGLKLALETVREGDCLVVWKLDRLGRSVKDLVAIVLRPGTAQRAFYIPDRSDRHVHNGRPLLFPCNGQPGADGTGPDRGAHPGRPGCGPPARPHWWSQTQDDRFKNSYCNAATAGRRAPTGSGKRPGRIYPDTVSMAAGITEDRDGRRRHRYTEVKSIR